MSLNEISLKIPNEHITNVFGQFDIFAKKKIERTLNVTIVLRDDMIKIIGTENNCHAAQEVFCHLI